MAWAVTCNRMRMRIVRTCLIYAGFRVYVRPCKPHIWPKHTRCPFIDCSSINNNAVKHYLCWQTRSPIASCHVAPVQTSTHVRNTGTHTNMLEHSLTCKCIRVRITWVRIQLNRKFRIYNKYFFFLFCFSKSTASRANIACIHPVHILILLQGETNTPESRSLLKTSLYPFHSFFSSFPSFFFFLIFIWLDLFCILLHARTNVSACVHERSRMHTFPLILRVLLVERYIQYMSSYIYLIVVFMVPVVFFDQLSLK